MTKTEKHAAVVGRVGVRKSTPRNEIRIIHQTPQKQKIIITPKLTTEQIQSTVLSVLDRFGYEPIDLEALIFFTLQSFDINPLSYENLYKIIRNHILHNFSLEQGPHVRLSEISMRRITVSYTRTE